MNFFHGFYVLNKNKETISQGKVTVLQTRIIIHCNGKTTRLPLQNKIIEIDIEGNIIFLS